MTTTDEPEIVIVERRIEPATLRRLVERHFEDMVKIEDAGLRERLRAITHTRIGAGEALG